MNIAFYAPLKAPDHASPSGDRTVARMLLSALRRAGHRVDLASRLRSLDRHGDAVNQARIRTRAARVTARLLARYQSMDSAHRPQLWFTYHLYHKAPDLIGPEVSRALKIPYVVAEASHAPKQSAGPWDAGYRAAAQAMKSAALIITLNPADEPCVRDLLANAATLRRVAPFIDTRASILALRDVDASTALRSRLGMSTNSPIIVCAAMMRSGDKLASYQLLAQALARITHLPWQLLILGDGRVRDQVADAMRAVGERVYWAGLVSQEFLPQWLAGCDLYTWPAVNEAWSMDLLEAAAVGVPAVAGNEGGVSSVIDDGRSGILTAARDVRAFAGAVESLLGDERRRRGMGEAARAKTAAGHDLAAASRALNQLLCELVR